MGMEGDYHRDIRQQEEEEAARKKYCRDHCKHGNHRVLNTYLKSHAVLGEKPDCKHFVRNY
jgi:hypothetical protein